MLEMRDGLVIGRLESGALQTISLDLNSSFTSPEDEGSDTDDSDDNLVVVSSWEDEASEASSSSRGPGKPKVGKEMEKQRRRL